MRLEDGNITLPTRMTLPVRITLPARSVLYARTPLPVCRGPPFHRVLPGQVPPQLCQLSGASADEHLGCAARGRAAT